MRQEIKLSYYCVKFCKKQVSGSRLWIGDKPLSSVLLKCHQRDANENHNEIPPHTSQNGHHTHINKQVLERKQRKGNPSALLVGMQTGAATVENSMEFPQKTKNGTDL